MQKVKFSINEEILSQTSSRGNQLKFYSDNFWYKYDTYGYEGLAEYIISKILLKNNINCVNYKIVEITYNGEIKLGVKSENFKQANQEVITLARLFQANGISLVSKEFNRLSTYDKIELVIDNVNKITKVFEFDKYLSNLLYVDKLFLNDDRHFNNILFLYDNETGEFHLSPIFDNGAGLLSDTRISYPMEESISRLIRKVKAKPFNIDFDKQYTEMCKLCEPTIKISWNMEEVETLIFNTPYSDKIKTRVCNILRLQQNKYNKSTGATNLF
jgi:predicted metallopeptidase